MKTKVEPGTVARTIVLFLALLNQGLAIAGKGTIDIAENDVYQIVSLVFTVGSTLIAWWKNNSFTPEAVEGDKLMQELKEGK